MKASPAVAKSYAKAVFELAREHHQADQVQAELERAAELITADGEVADVLGRPWISRAKRKQLAEEIGQKLELSKLGRDFLGLLAAQGRADHLVAITAAYRDMLDEIAGRCAPDVARPAVACGRACARRRR